MERDKEIKEHLGVFKEDLKESKRSKSFFSFYTLSDSYHLIKDPLADRILRRSLTKRIGEENIPKVITRFMHNEGGIYKIKAYKICNNIKKIKGSTILIPGCGFGKNLIPLLDFYPKEVVALDLFEYPEEWKYLEDYAKKRGIKITFLKDDMSKVVKKYKSYFDFVISDALLEHVKELDFVIKSSSSVLKKGGIFYAGFGPLWFGPSGDHVHWGERRIFDHLLISKKDYNKNVKIRQSKEDIDSFALINESLFSYKKVEEYFNSFGKNKFSPIKIFAKISSEALKTLKDKRIARDLDKKKVPLFDRYCPGLYVWLKKR